MRTYTVRLFRDCTGAEPISAGDYLYRRGQPGTTMYIVMDGEIVMRSGNTIVERIGPGAVLGDLEVLEGRPRVTDAVAETDGLVLRLDRRQFLFFVQTRPHFAELMVHDLTDRLRELIEGTVAGPTAPTGRTRPLA
ncbi:MAG: cyclic nucleotide-binding domain-containing protein [Planctomycetes bacterium]|nr:cyclic nucleotide-binding domain-containing protein [Planctomycetota bacterium]